MANSQILICQSPAGYIKIDVRLKEETVWLTQTLIVDFFQTTRYINGTVPVFSFNNGLNVEKYPNEKNGGAISGAISGAIGGAIELTDRQKEILNLIKQDNKIAYREIAEKLGINNSAVQSHLDHLKEKGVLKRVGGTRGHWEVMNYEG